MYGSCRGLLFAHAHDQADRRRGRGEKNSCTLCAGDIWDLLILTGCLGAGEAGDGAVTEVRA